MEVKKIVESYNPIFERKELSFFIDHISQASPRLSEVRQSLAENYNLNEEAVYVTRLDTMTGTNRCYGKAEIYDSPENAKKVVPRHIQMRNQLRTKQIQT